jgi:superfamily II DNA or RNA helicase
MAAPRPSADDIRKSWKNSLNLFPEEVNKEGKILKKGLRTPQLGAYYRVLSHWCVSRDHGIIVLPTGVGKTDTMITIMVGCMCERILVVVPSIALRDQIAGRFSELGVLPKYNLISKSAKKPKVTIQEHRFESLSEIDRVCRSANVIITTASLFAKFPDGHLERLASNCSHLFLDEAHHTQAPKTWAKIQNAFRSKPALLFTATPFRNDEKALHGDLIFNYPLSKAQKEGYFTRIEQHPVTVYNTSLADEAIADKAIELLEADLPSFPKHLVMARANDITRAESIFKIYETKYSRYNPLLIHSNISEKERIVNQKKFETGKSKIAVCVDMFGEGYDLPEIKIGAFHDMRRNITTALQLIGRFTRHRSDLGTAKFVYNSAEGNSSSEILQLLGDDVDWNLLIPNLSEGKTKKQQELEKFVKAFEPPRQIPIQNLRPAFSLVGYLTDKTDWTPERYVDYFNENDFVSIKDLSNKENTLIIIGAEKISLDWIKGLEYYNIEHHLYILHWIKGKKILLIHSSKTGGHYYKGLAKAVLGEDIALISGEKIYRALHKVERIKFHGLGLIEPFGRSVSYTQRSGSNVLSGTSVTDLFNRSKQVLQGTGYKNGDHISFGVTSKGRVWSFRRENISELVKWDKELAGNLLDESIDTSQLVKHVALQRILTTRPNLRPFTIEWPDLVYQESLSFGLFDKEDQYFSLNDSSLQLHEPSINGNIQFSVATIKFVCVFSLSINDQGYKIVPSKGPKIFLGNKKRLSLENWFTENPPTIYFIDGSFLVDGNQYTKLGQSLRVFDFRRIETIDWIAEGVDIKSESEGIDRHKKTSIQYYLINKLVKSNYDIVFNDDDQDETADIVTLRVDDARNQVILELYHCKFSSETKPGCRLADLYTVLGQSQKNIRWLDDNHRFIEQLIIREEGTNRKSDSLSRLRKGSLVDLKVISKKVKNEYALLVKVFAVQPGLSSKKFKDRAEDSNEVERLFAVTEDYIKATKQGEFYIICSP